MKHGRWKPAMAAPAVVSAADAAVQAAVIAAAAPAVIAAAEIAGKPALKFHN